MWGSSVFQFVYQDMEYLLKKLLLIIQLTFTFCDTQDILGCGGFVKSDIDINFSQVEVKL